MNLKLTSAALAGIAVLAMIAVQFAPWASYETSGTTPGFDFGFGSSPGFTFDVEITSYTWLAKIVANGGKDTTSWYDSDADDSEGVGLIRAAIPLLLVGTVLGLVGALLAAGRTGATGPVLTLVAGLVLAVGVTLFAIGTTQFYEDVDHTWSASFYLAISACVLTLAGGVVGLVAGNTRSSSTAF